MMILITTHWKAAREEGCYFYFTIVAQHNASNLRSANGLSSVLTPVNMLAHCAPSYQQRHWSPAYGLLLHWHHSKLIPPHTKPASLTKLTITLYKRAPRIQQLIAELIKKILSDYDIELSIQVLDYEQWYYGDAKSDIWLATVNFYKPLEFSIFAALYELPYFTSAWVNVMKMP